MRRVEEARPPAVAVVVARVFEELVQRGLVRRDAAGFQRVWRLVADREEASDE